MFDSTFFKFLITFILIIGMSFLLMGIVSGLDQKNTAETFTQISH